MIHSILDNDLYKLTMQNAVINLFPRALVKYEFISRDNITFPDNFDIELKKIINQMSNIQLSKVEYNFLINTCYFLPPTYFDFLNGYKYNADEIKINFYDNKLKIIIEGFWYRTILWEVPLMAIISELYFKMTNQKIDTENDIIKKTEEKAKLYNKIKINYADFGTRRRYSFDNHELVVKTLSKNSPNNFVGTSNVYFAFKYGLTPIGTHAHEWFMFHAAKYGFKIANKLALENWVKTYRGDLGIALSDTFTTDVFFKSFDTKLAKLFDGVRHDSGDPIEFAEKTINHYKSLRIDPITKTIVFSDGLNPETVEKINNFCENKIKTSYGIGTNFTNDVGVKALNMVIKLKEAKPEGWEWTPTIKLSDSKGKHSGDAETIETAKKVLKII